MWKKIAANGSKVAVIETINHYFDGAYVPVVALLGPWVGGLIMTVAAIALNYRFVRVYNGSSGDWYGFEWMRGKVRTTWWGKLVAMPYGLAWSFWDPFAGFIFIRGKQDTQYRFGFEDWVLLAGLTTFASVLWTLLAELGLQLLKMLWHIMF